VETAGTGPETCGRGHAACTDCRFGRIFAAKSRDQA
jgi:hypothetical protein